MPIRNTVGPYYFSSVVGAAWLNPSNVQGAPDGVFAANGTFSTTSYTGYLTCTNWGGVPFMPNTNGYANVVSALIEANIDGPGPFSVNTWACKAHFYRTTAQGATVIGNMNVPVPVVGWASLYNASALAYSGTVDTAFGIEIAWEQITAQAGIINVDSIRMTLTIDTPDDAYGLKRRTEFVDAQGNILFETLRP